MKKSNGGTCVHCLKHCSAITWDHVIPRAWYPESTPRELEKWKIPSCWNCNREYGALESDLLLRFALCLDPTDIHAAGIPDRVLRGIKPEYAKNDRDRRAREAKRRQIKAQTLPVDRAIEGALPGFGLDGQREGGTAILVPRDALLRFGEKLVRGITYIETNRTIGREFDIEIHFVHDSGAREFREAIERYAISSHRGPGVVVERAYLPDDPVQGIFRVTIWKRFRVNATVSLRVGDLRSEGS